MNFIILYLILSPHYLADSTNDKLENDVENDTENNVLDIYILLKSLLTLWDKNYVKQ